MKLGIISLRGSIRGFYHVHTLIWTQKQSILVNYFLNFLERGIGEKCDPGELICCKKIREIFRNERNSIFYKKKFHLIG